MFDSLYSVINWMLHARAHHRRIPWQWLGEPGLAMWSVIILNVWRGFPFSAVILLAGLTAVPTEVIEAAKIDGAARCAASHYVVAPDRAADPASSGLLYSIVFSFTDFSAVWLLTRAGPTTPPTSSGPMPTTSASTPATSGMGAAITLFMLPLLAVIVVAHAAVAAEGVGVDAHALATNQARLRAVPAAVAVPASSCCSRSTGWSSPPSSGTTTSTTCTGVPFWFKEPPTLSPHASSCSRHPVPDLAQEQPADRGLRWWSSPWLIGLPAAYAPGPDALLRQPARCPPRCSSRTWSRRRCCSCPLSQVVRRHRVRRLDLVARPRLSVLHAAVLHLAAHGLRADGAARRSRRARSSDGCTRFQTFRHDRHPGHHARHHHRRHLRLHARRTRSSSTR